MEERFIQNLYRDGTRLRFFRAICRIGKNSGGTCQTRKLVSSLMEEAKTINSSVSSGRIGSETTANDYVENAIAFGLGRRVGSMFRLRPLGKALACLGSNPTAPLSAEEKTVLLTSYLRNDFDAFYRLVTFLRKENGASVSDIVEEHWNEIFRGTPLVHLVRAARLHRTIPRLEWYLDLGIVEKAENNYVVSDRAQDLVNQGNQMILFDLSCKFYCIEPESKTETIYVEEFRKVVEDTYLTLLMGFFPHSFEVEIDTLRSLILTQLTRRKTTLSVAEFNEMLLDYWKSNLDRVRLTSSSTVQGREEEGITDSSRLYSYISIHTSTNRAL